MPNVTGENNIHFHPTLDLALCVLLVPGLKCYNGQQIRNGVVIGRKLPAMKTHIKFGIKSGTKYCVCVVI